MGQKRKRQEKEKKMSARGRGRGRGRGGVRTSTGGASSYEAEEVQTMKSPPPLFPVCTIYQHDSLKNLLLKKGTGRE